MDVLTRLLVVTILALIMVGVSLAGLMWGWGLEPQNWGWIIGSYVVMMSPTYIKALTS